jgi:hypothetical protein
MTTTRVAKEAALSIAIGKASVLSKLAAQEIMEQDSGSLDKVFETSNITADNYLCLLFALRDTVDEICSLSGVPV